MRVVLRRIAVAALVAAPALLALPSRAAAQATGRVSGTVTGEGGQPIPGAQVGVAGTALGATTGDDGRYTIVDVAAGTRTLRVQRIGYRPITQQVTVTAGETARADFVLEPLPSSLTAQVVVGYTTQQRRDVSDAVSDVQAEDIQDQAVATVEEALRGRVPGVQILASGEPGRAPQVIVRGQNFFTNPSPLYVVDGMYLQQNPNLNPDDIESIEVLKDASAAAQYGAQAANGVIVIRTRRGRTGDNRVELRSYYGYQQVPTTIDMMGLQRWGEIEQAAFQNSNPARAVPADIAAAAAGTGTINTNWQDALLRNGAIQDHNLAISGGSQNANYLLSGGFLDQQGAIVATGFRRYSFRANSELRRSWLTVGQNLSLSRTRKQNPVGAPLLDALRMLPTIPVRDPSSASGWGYGTDASPTFGTNPVAVQYVRPSEYTSNQLLGTAYGQIGLPYRLRYRLNLGVNYNAFSQNDFSSIQQVRYRTVNPYATLTEGRGNFTSLLAENLLSYDNTFGGGMHRLNAVAGYTVQRQDFDSVLVQRQGYSDENLRTIDAGDLAGQRTGGPQVHSRLIGMLARANYALLDRYLLTGSLRRDGSSRFGPGNRYGTFGAVSAGWVVSDEPFFHNTPVIDRASYLKLRASYGTLGNQDIGDYRTSGVLNQTRNYIFGGNIFGGITQTNLVNPSLRWQENQQTDIGLDLGLLGDRLTFTADWYRSLSNGLLVDLPVPLSLGSFNNPTVNAGKMRNTGLELGLTHHWRTGDLELNSTATFSTNRNRVLSLGTGGQPIFGGPGGVTRTAVGGSIGEFYLVDMIGIFQTQQEIDNYRGGPGNTVIQPGAQPGDIKYRDVNGDGRFNFSDDRYNAGNGTPKYSGGLFFDGKFRSVDFGLNLRGAGGFKVFNAIRYWTDRLDDPSALRADINPWTPTNGSQTDPRATLTPPQNNVIFQSDRFLEKGDYLRIQNIILGYTLPGQFTSRLGAAATTARIYLNIQNAHTFTDFTNWDPESPGNGGALERGVDDARVFPNVRTVSLGLDLRL